EIVDLTNHRPRDHHHVPRARVVADDQQRPAARQLDLPDPAGPRRGADDGRSEEVQQLPHCPANRVVTLVIDGFSGHDWGDYKEMGQGVRVGELTSLARLRWGVPARASGSSLERGLRGRYWETP